MLFNCVNKSVNLFIRLYLLILLFTRKYKKQLLGTGINASNKVIHKTAKATQEFLGNKIADAVTTIKL